MSELKTRLETIRTHATSNNANLVLVLAKVRSIIENTRVEQESKITELTEKLNEAKTANDLSNTEKDKKVIELEKILAQEKEKTEGIEEVLTSIETALNDTNVQLQSTNQDPFNVENLNTYGGKSTKRKRHNKKHSKNKSHRLRNKKHKSK